MSEELLAMWDFISNLIFAAAGKCDAYAADSYMDLFPEVGTRDEIKTEDDLVKFLDTGNPLDPTVWWRQSTRSLYLGVVGDDEGSIVA